METILHGAQISGKANLELKPDIAVRIGLALGTFLGKNSTVVTSRDFRPDCRMLKRALTAGLMATGVNTIDFHAAITPLLQFAIKRFGTNAGVAITSGHGSQDRILIRIFDSTSVEMSKDQITQILQLLEPENFYRVTPDNVGQLSYVHDAFTIYQTALNRFIDSEEIKKSKFRVVIDSALGPTSNIAPSLFSKANCDVIALNSYQPAHIPEILPNPESVRKVSQTIVATTADLGIVFDVGGNRVIFLDNSGNLIHPDDLVCFFLQNRILDKGKKGSIVISDSISQSVEPLLKSEEEHLKLERVISTPGKIATRLRDVHGLFGASDQGEYMFPNFSLESDGILAAMVLLEMMARDDRSLSERLADIPKFPVVRYNVPCRSDFVGQMFDVFRENSPQGTYSIDTLIGVKFVFPKCGWVHIHPSLTRDNLVLSAEAEKFSETDKILKQAKEFVNEIIGKLKTKG